MTKWISPIPALPGGHPIPRTPLLGSGGPKQALWPCLSSRRLAAEVEKEAVSLRSEELSEEGDSQQRPQQSPGQQSLLPVEPEQGPAPLMVQLSLLRAETDRLREVLAGKEREYQALVQRALQRLNEEVRTYAPAPEPPAALSTDQGLVQWLQELNVDSGTIQMVRWGVLGYP